MQNILNLLRNKLEFMLDENTLSSSILDTEQSAPHLLTDSPTTSKENSPHLAQFLTPLCDVDGYLASTLFNRNGELLACHHPYATNNIDMIGTAAAAMINDMIKATHSIESGKFEFIEITIDGLHPLWRITDEYFMAILLDADTRTGAGFAKVALEAVYANISRSL